MGAFAVGTEAFMISALLPSISGNLAVSLQAAGQLVTIFALTYALSSPVFTALTGGVDRRKLLMLSMAAFAAANLIAAAAPGYWFLVFARVLLALSAGLYVPNANALAGALAPPERRGRALAIVTGGISAAIALGVPLGALIGARFGWRMTFVGVAALAAAAWVGLFLGLPRHIGAGLPTASLHERIAVVRRPAVLLALLVTTLWACGSYTVYTYIAPLVMTAGAVSVDHVGYVPVPLRDRGFHGTVPRRPGQRQNRRAPGHFHRAAPHGSGAAQPVVVGALLAALAGAHSPTLRRFRLGLHRLGIFPAQQTRLIGLAGVKVAPVILSLNASFMYLGISLGAALGSLTLTLGKVADIGWVGALCVLTAFALFLATHRDLQPNDLKGFS